MEDDISSFMQSLCIFHFYIYSANGYSGGHKMSVLQSRTLKLCVSLIVVLIFTASSYAAIDLKSIVASWLFDEGSGAIAKDSSGNGKDGSIKGGAKWVAGKFNKAIELNGTDAWTEVPSIGTFDEVTITAWVMVTGRIGQWRPIINNNGWKAGDIHHQLYADNRVGFSLCGNTGGDDQFGKFLFDDSQLNKWHHIATTYSDKTKKVQFYVDGQFDVETAWGGNKGVIGPARIGSWDGGGREWQGMFDEFAIFNVVLSVDDINTVMDKGMKILAAVSNQDKLTTTWATVKTDF